MHHGLSLPNVLCGTCREAPDSPASTHLLGFVPPTGSCWGVNLQTKTCLTLLFFFFFLFAKNLPQAPFGSWGCRERRGCKCLRLTSLLCCRVRNTNAGPVTAHWVRLSAVGTLCPCSSRTAFLLLLSKSLQLEVFDLFSFFQQTHFPLLLFVVAAVLVSNHAVVHSRTSSSGVWAYIGVLQG